MAWIKGGYTCLRTHGRAILWRTGTWTHLSTGEARCWENHPSGRNDSSWLSRQAFVHRLWGRVSIYSVAMVFLGQWEEGILEQMIWGNPNSLTVASEMSVHREQAPMGLALCRQVDFGYPSLLPYHCFQIAVSTIYMISTPKCFSCSASPSTSQAVLIIDVHCLVHTLYLRTSAGLNKALDSLSSFPSPLSPSQ